MEEQTVESLREIYDKKYDQALKCLELVNKLKKETDIEKLGFEISIQTAWEKPKIQVVNQKKVDIINLKKVRLEIERIIERKLKLNIVNDYCFENQIWIDAWLEWENDNPDLNLRDTNTFGCEFEYVEETNKIIKTKCQLN